MVIDLAKRWRHQHLRRLQRYLKILYDTHLRLLPDGNLGMFDRFSSRLVEYLKDITAFQRLFSQLRLATVGGMELCIKHILEEFAYCILDTICTFLYSN